MAILGRSAKGAGALLASLSLLAVVPAVPVSAGPVVEPACVVTRKKVEAVYTYATLQDAVDGAIAGDRLTVRGVCHGITTIDRNLTIVGMKPQGQPLPILDGDAGGSVVTVPADVTVTIRTLRITGGTGDPCGVDCTHGGGIGNQGTLTLDGVVVAGNTAIYGGGIHNAEGTLILTGSTSVRGNQARSGGGIRNDGGIVTLIGSASVADNTAVGRGGGIDTSLGTLAIRGSASIHQNSVASGDGGGIYNDHAALTLAGAASVRGNSAVNGGGILSDGTFTFTGSASVHHNTASDGGGIRNVGTLTVSGTASVHHNTVVKGGGGGIRNSGSLTISGSASVAGNTAVGYGGGIRNDGTLTLKGSASVAGNTAAGGGGLFNDYNGTTVLKGSSSVNHNTAGRAGGIYDYGLIYDGLNYGGLLTLTGYSSVHHNTATAHGSGIYASGPITLSGHASVHHNSSDTAFASGAIEIPGLGQMFTMKRHSSVTANAGGTGGGGIVVWPACSATAIITGARSRTSGNTPGQVVTAEGQPACS